jgi:hypothetical protein
MTEAQHDQLQQQGLQNYARVLAVLHITTMQYALQSRHFQWKERQLLPLLLLPLQLMQAGVLSQLLVSLQVGAQYLMDCRIGPGLYVARVSCLLVS